MINIKLTSSNIENKTEIWIHNITVIKYDQK